MNEIAAKYNVRLEVMQHMEKDIAGYVDKYLIPIEENWQPFDFLPDPKAEGFTEKINELREACKELPYDFWIVLIGDMLTEEALPTYESWLMSVDGINAAEANPWSKWISAWTAEENRHGDLLNRYLYLSGRVNMREIEITTQYLIAEGFDIGTARDPYKNFVYTSFQELATRVSHFRVARLASKYGVQSLSRICTVIASDEMRHHLAYREFVQQIFLVDPNEMMLALEYMMRRKIIMPAMFLRESGGQAGDAFVHFSNCAERLNVYTFRDYIDIMEKLFKFWKLEDVEGLEEDGKRARDYLLGLVARMKRIADRKVISQEQYDFKWVHRNGRYKEA